MSEYEQYGQNQWPAPGWGQTVKTLIFYLVGVGSVLLSILVLWRVCLLDNRGFVDKRI